MISSPATRPAPDLPPGPRAALVVATSSYADAGLTRLESTARDAAEMAAVLADPGIGAFEVTSLVDRGAQEVRLAVEDFLARRGRDDLVVVYLSCHGLLDARDRLYFAAADTQRDRLAATGVESRWLLSLLEECRAARQVVILDCCFSGAFARGGKGGADTDLRLRERLIAHGRGRTVLTASKAGERSWEGKPAKGAAVPSMGTSQSTTRTPTRTRRSSPVAPARPRSTGHSTRKARSGSPATRPAWPSSPPHCRKRSAPPWTARCPRSASVPWAPWGNGSPARTPPGPWPPSRLSSESPRPIAPRSPPQPAP
jgi:Caspase domain